MSKEPGAIQTPKAERDPKGFIEEVLRTVHERNLDQLVQFFAEDCEFIDMTQPEPARGREALREIIHETWQGLPDFRPESWTLIADGNQVAAELQLVGRHEGEFLGYPPTGRVVRWPASAFYKLTPACDQIVRETYYYDLATLTAQLTAKEGDGNA